MLEWLGSYVACSCIGVARIFPTGGMNSPTRGLYHLSNKALPSMQVNFPLCQRKFHEASLSNNGRLNTDRCRFSLSLPTRKVRSLRFIQVKSQLKCQRLMGHTEKHFLVKEWKRHVVLLFFHPKGNTPNVMTFDHQKNYLVSFGGVLNIVTTYDSVSLKHSSMYSMLREWSVSLLNAGGYRVCQQEGFC